MKKNQIQIGKVYSVKVSGNVVHVRINSVRFDGKGWTGINLKTGREIVIKTAARCRREIPAEYSNTTKDLAAASGAAFKAVAQRQNNAMNRFVESVMEQFGFTKAEAEHILAVYRKLEVVKIDSIGGQYRLASGVYWAKDVMARAIGIEV